MGALWGGLWCHAHRLWCHAQPTLPGLLLLAWNAPLPPLPRPARTGWFATPASPCYFFSLQWMQNAVQMTSDLVGAVNAERQKQGAAVQSLAGASAASGGSAKKKGTAARREEKKRR